MFGNEQSSLTNVMLANTTLEILLAAVALLQVTYLIT